MTPPAWVHKRDGRLVPFEADKISRSLFAAAEQAGRPDAFLARELTDGVLHFLSGEADERIPTTAEIAELVAKVVRELGQPALARAYADFARPGSTRPAKKAVRPEAIAVHFTPADPLPSVLADCRRAFALGAVFTRDLAAAHRDGLLTLEGLDAPLELAASAPAPPAPLLECLLEARQHTAGVVALDGAEYAVESLIPDLATGLRATGLRAVVNLNTASPPPWTGDLADGPLFAARRPAADPGRAADTADSLLPALIGTPATRIDWHLSERDFAPASAGRLHRVARPAAEGAAIAFVFDRPRRPVALAEGLDRKHPALLLTVSLHLPRLAALPGAGADPAHFLQKLGSLARLALSAAVQKRDFLRRQAADRPALTRGFFLDRARLMVAPVGLDAAARALTGSGLCDGKGLDFGRQVVRRLREVLTHDGRACLIDSCLDGEGGAEGPVLAQLRAAGALHAAADGGTMALLTEAGRPPSAEQIVEWLRHAWSQTEAGRVSFPRPASAHRQLTLPV